MRIQLLLVLLLAACSKTPAPPASALSAASAQALSAFDDTKQQSEERILGIASAALRAGIPLDSARAERCWREEAARPAVQEACALLWAGLGEESQAMDSALLGTRSRAVSIALLQRRPLIGKIAFPELIERLDSLAEDPLWLRAEIAKAWIEARGSPGLAQSDALAQRIRPSDGSGPRDLSSSFSAIRLLRYGAWQEALNSYCDSAAGGESRLRCWRLLAVIESAGEGLGRFLPLPNDNDDWTLFTRTFPGLAEKIQAKLR